ncbi:hypothetical protein RJ641_000937 [Dillenia turbinata]|uniref:Myb-like domain-containing protein n=1 Tax=Dillenia turbinata TaxID=194707 RepID=A0AAN8WCV6_9MAGN
MDFIDEETRPRFLFQSRSSSSSTSHSHQSKTLDLKSPSLIISLALSLLLISLILFVSTSESLNVLLLWCSLSLLLGPFAPSSLTGGDIRVGLGEPVDLLSDPSPTPSDDDSKKKSSNRRSRPRQVQELGFGPVNPVNASVDGAEKLEETERENKDTARNSSSNVGEWCDEDFEMLKKQMGKHPVGKPRRWEIITEAFGGKYKVESVIKMGKSMAEKRLNDGDSYAEFLKNRKVVDKRVENGDGEREMSIGDDNGGLTWSNGEDIALLNALKAFPKDTSMRWEKIAAAVPGKSKAACMKRVAELKRDFRSSKSATET